MADTREWPLGGGEAARLIRAQDWAGTPLGPPGNWPQSLRTMVEMMLAAPHVATLAVGPARHFLYNDDAARLYGDRHPAALGRSLPEAFAHEFGQVAAFYDRVFAGESLHIHAQALDPAETGAPELFDAYLSPVRDSEGRVIAAYMTGFAVGERTRAETRLRESRERLTDDLADATLLSDLAERLVTEENVETIYDEILTAAIRISRADAGTVQIYDAATKSLVLLVSRNFERKMTDHFHRVDADSRTACGSALGTGERTFLDFDESGTDEACVMHVEAGYRSAQAIPLVSRSGAPLGMLNTHWREARHRPSERALRYLDLLARQAADLIEQRQAAQTLRESEERFRSFAENSTDVLWIVNAETRELEYLSPSFAAMWGESRERVMADIGRWAQLVHPDDRGRASLAMRRSLDGETVMQSYRIIRPFDGAERWIQDTGFPIRDGKGRITRIGGVAQDLTERTRTELEIRAKRRELRILVEHIPQLVWRAGAGGLWTWASPQWSAFTGQSEKESEGWGWMEPIHPDDRDAAEVAWREAQRTGRFEADYRLRNREGVYRWFQTRATPVHSEDGELTEWFGTSTDIDDLRRVQEHERLLSAELQHRVRNTLGVVRSLLRRTIRTSTDLEDYAMHLEGRIEAFSRVQSSVTRDPVRGVDLEYLVAEELRAVGGREGDTFTVKGPEILLSAKPAETLGLALHELATNALKHGALTAPRGEIKVRWEKTERDEAPALELAWLEQGLSGLPPQPSRRGFGTELLSRTLAYDLKAKVSLDFRPTGLECRISVPLAQLRAQQGLARLG